MTKKSKTHRNKKLSVSLAALSMAALGTTAAAQDMPNETESEALTEEVLLVYGRRGAIEKATELQRQADDFRSIVTADDIGQFGDPTVAESLQRISGVSINRTNGEGQQVSIRGLPTEFATITLNGARLGTSDNDINSTNLDFFAADNLSQIDVIKTLTPERDADAIAGTIDLKMISAFARGKDSFGGRIEYGYQEKPDEFNPKISGDFTKLIDLDNGRLGFAGGVSWSERTTITDQRRADDGLFFFVLEEDDGELEYDNDADNCGDALECYLLPEEFDERSDLRERTSFSLNGSIDYQVGEHLFALRGSYSDSETDRLLNRQTFILDRSEGEIGDEVFEFGVDDSGQLFGIYEDGRSEIRSSPFSEDSKVYTFGFEGTSIFNDAWIVNYGFDYSSNDYDEEQIEGRFRADDIRMVFSSIGKESVDITLLPEAATAAGEDDEDDPTVASGFGLRNDRVNQRFEDSDDTYETFYVNIEREFDMFGRDAAFKFGGKVRSRERSFDFDRLEWFVSEDITLADFNASSNIPNTDLNIAFIPDTSQLEPTLRELIAGGELATVEDVGTFIAIADKERDYTAEEDVTAAYVQLTFNPADNVQVIAGIRVEQTDYESTGSQFREIVYNDDASDILEDALDDGGVSGDDIDAFLATREDVVPFETFTGTNDYTDVFPSINIRWEPTDNTLVRFSYTEGIKRPEFREAAAISQLETSENLDNDLLEEVIADDFGGALNSIDEANDAIADTQARQLAEEGETAFETEGERIRNPRLDPLTSQNWDVSFDWYPNERTVISIAAFYKEIENFIVPLGLSGNDVTRLGFEVDDGTINSQGVSEVDTFVNGDEAEISGVEINYYQAYTFLPAPFNGLFVQANATFADSEASAPQVDRTFEFPDQSDVIGNLSIGWENEVFSIRGAAVFQGDRLRALNDAGLDDANDPAGDVLEDDRTQIDINIRYQVTEDIQVYFDAININDAEDLRYYDVGRSTGGNVLNNSLFQELENYGPTYQLGVRARF